MLRGYVPDEMETITGHEFEHAAHLGPTEDAIEATEVAALMDGEVVDE